MTHTTREAWLVEMSTRLAPLFEAHGYPLPRLRIACGFPSKRPNNGTRNQAIGQCWSHRSSADGTVELMVSPVLSSPMRVADVLAHELVHAAVGVECGHKGPFKMLARAIGLEGKLTATIAGEAFKRTVQPMLDAVGPYPHAPLDARGDSSGPKKQSTRMLKVACPDCGYTVRLSRTWLEQGAPLCPVHEIPMEE